MLNNLTALLDSGAPAAVGDFESIQTYTVGAGDQATIDFTSISGTYKHLQIRYIVKVSDGFGLGLQFNSDTGSNYTRHRLQGNGSAASATGGGGQTIMNFNSGNGYPDFGAGIIDILDYTSTNKAKTVRVLDGIDQNGSGAILLESGLWYATPAAITSIQLKQLGSGVFSQYSSFALYGVK